MNFWGVWPAIVPVGVHIHAAHRFDRVSLSFRGEAQLTEYLSTHPKQKDSSCEHEPHHLRQLRCGRGDRETGPSARL